MINREIVAGSIDMLLNIVLAYVVNLNLTCMTESMHFIGVNLDQKVGGGGSSLAA